MSGTFPSREEFERRLKAVQRKQKIKLNRAKEQDYMDFKCKQVQRSKEFAGR